MVAPLLLFELACAKTGFDRFGLRGAIDGAGFGSIAAGWPALLLAIAFFDKRPRTAAITMIVVYAQWAVFFALFGQWREAGVAALGVGTPWLAKKVRSYVDRWMHDRPAGLAAVVAITAAYPALLTFALERVWTPNSAMLSVAHAAYPSSFYLSAFSLVGVVMAIVKNRPPSHRATAVAAAVGAVTPLGLAWSFPALLAPPVAATALAACSLWALLVVAQLLLSSVVQPLCRP